MKVKKFFFFFFFFFFEFGHFYRSQIWEKHLIFALVIGAEIRPQNRPRKIPESERIFFQKVNFENNQHTTKKHEKLPSMQ